MTLRERIRATALRVSSQSHKSKRIKSASRRKGLRQLLLNTINGHRKVIKMNKNLDIHSKSAESPEKEDTLASHTFHVHRQALSRACLARLTFSRNNITWRANPGQTFIHYRTIQKENLKNVHSPQECFKI